jgi:hypothetical protein
LSGTAFISACISMTSTMEVSSNHKVTVERVIVAALEAADPTAYRRRLTRY